MKRIIWHWSAGAHKASDLDRKHYHFIIEGDGRVVEGTHKPEDNEDTRDGNYAAHTLNANTGAIGVAVAAMAGALERPFNAGKSPITTAQAESLVALTSALCRAYNIPVTRATVLSHAEVQPTLGIKQRGKWDIAWLPGMPSVGDPVAVGDRLRALVIGYHQPVARPPKNAERPRNLAGPAAAVLALLAALGASWDWITSFFGG